MEKIAIRTSNELFSGRGHLERCLQIRKYIKKNVIWFLDKRDKEIENKICKKDKIIYEGSPEGIKKLVSYINEERINYVLLDTYHVSGKKLKKKLLKNVFILTLSDTLVSFKTNLIIIPQPLYFNKSNCIIKSGPDYIPISKKYIIRKKSTENKNTILISMGAIDKRGITIDIINALKSCDFLKPEFKIVVILGNKAPHLAQIRNITKNFKKFQLVVNKRNMNSIYKKTFFAIGAPGLSHAERLAAGVPTILIAQNKLHQNIIKGWVKLNCALSSSTEKKNILQNVHKIIFNNKIREDIINCGNRIIDGKGANRIANEINIV